ncbi:MAG: SDR family oxidoreductase [Chloroflexota bacterium]|nr:SDR family oxidoreductase [Chloroflexota bacterium]
MTDCVALITGGSRGIGLATGRLLAARGDHVVLAARSGPDLEAAVAGIGEAGGSASAWAGDVTDPEACRAMVDQALGVAGGIDICVLSAGVGHWAPTVSMSDDEWRETMSVNADAAFYVTRAVLPSMIERGTGHLVFISSVLSRKGAPNMAAYAASKAAVAAFGESVAAEVKPLGIKVTVVSPGTTATGMRDHQVGRPQTPDITDPELQLAPEDVSDAIAWATSVSDRTYPTGVTIEPRGTAGSPPR